MSAARFLILLVLILVPVSSPLPDDDAEALLSFKNSLAAAPLFSWREGTEPCKDRWIGVFCAKDNDDIIRIHLPRMGLSGIIDVDSLSKLESLRTISLINNSFTGILPAFNSMKSLRALYLTGNKLSGEIPDDFFVGMDSLSRVWLSNNDLTGLIPGSLGELPHLNQLHLENNQFSGEIPDISQSSLSDLDFSNNKLTGRVPESMARFSGKAFVGNTGICGKVVGSECKSESKNVGGHQAPTTATTPREEDKRSGASMMTALEVMGCVMVVMILLLLVNLCVKPKNEAENNLSVWEKEQIKPQVVAVRPKDNEQYTIKKDGSKKGIADLVMVNDEKGSFSFADLMKAAAEVLGNGALGSAYKAVLDNGFPVVVKRIKNMNKLGKDAFDAELRGIAKIRHPNILGTLAYHYRKEEKLMISECISKGSLLYVMHGDRGDSHADLNWATRLNIIKGVASGMKFLHEQFPFLDLPHGNLKSSNVLLDDRNEPLLNDYGYLPFLTVTEATQGLFAFKTPEALNNKQVSPQSDVYCLGIVILEVLTGKFPSQYVSGGKGATDVIQWVQMAIQETKEDEVLDPEIASYSSNESIKNMVQLLYIGAKCTLTDPRQRPTMKDAASMIEAIKA